MLKSQDQQLYDPLNLFNYQDQILHILNSSLSFAWINLPLLQTSQLLTLAFFGEKVLYVSMSSHKLCKMLEHKLRKLFADQRFSRFGSSRARRVTLHAIKENC